VNFAWLALHSSPTDVLGRRDAGGMSVVLVELSAALARRGHRVDLFTCRGVEPPGVAVAVAPGVRRIRLGSVPAGVAKEALPSYLPSVAAEWLHWVAERGWRYDCVYSHYWLSAVVGQRAAERLEVPHWVTFHTLGAAKNRLACGEDEPPERLAAERDLARRCDRVVAPSARERDLLVSCGGLSPGRVALVPWGVNRERFCPGDPAAARAGWGLEGGADVLLFVGRFVPVKGLDLLLQALPEVVEEHPGVRLLVAGGGDTEDADRRAALALADRLGVAGRVTWLGPVTQPALAALYRAADLLVVPSRYESFGLAALEALACGTPVVATAVGALDQVVRSGVNGQVVQEAAPHPLAAAICAQLAGPRPSPQAVCASVADWTWDRAAAQMEQG